MTLRGVPAVLANAALLFGAAALASVAFLVAAVLTGIEEAILAVFIVLVLASLRRGGSKC